MRLSSDVELKFLTLLRAATQVIITNNGGAIIHFCRTAIPRLAVVMASNIQTKTP
jgi:hypothetical protein